MALPLPFLATGAPELAALTRRRRRQQPNPQPPSNEILTETGFEILTETGLPLFTDP